MGHAHFLGGLFFDGKSKANQCIQQLVGLVALVSATNSAFAQTAELPGMRFKEAPLVTPSVATSDLNAVSVSGETPIYYCSNGSLSLQSSCTDRPLEIREVARGLGAGHPTDTKYIQLSEAEYIKNAYEYVRNTIEITPTFGLSKGAVGALIDRHGTAFDQAQLLVELLNQKPGITATYEYGTLSLPGSAFQSWLGASTPYAACKLLANGGIPGTVAGTQDCDTLDSQSWGSSTVQLAHVWVKVVTGSYTYRLDPSYKTHAVKTALPNLPDFLGYSTSDYYSSAVSGADVQSSKVRKLNPYGMGSKLYAYSNAFMANVDANIPNARPEDIIGGRRIETDLASGALMPPNTYIADVRSYGSAATTKAADWSVIPDGYRTVITFGYGDPGNGGFERIFFADEIYGRSLSIQNFDEISRAGKSPTLNIGGLDVAQVSSRAPSFYLRVDHPYAANSNGFMDATSLKKMGVGASNTSADMNGNVSVVLELGATGRSRPDYARNTLQQAALPLELQRLKKRLSHRLQRDVIIAEWSAQVSQLARLVEGVAGPIIQHHHSVGYVNDGAYWAQNTTPIFKGFRIDVDSALSMAMPTINVNKERAIRIAFAATSATLEGMNAASAVDGSADISFTSAVSSEFDELAFNGNRTAAYIHDIREVLAANDPGSLENLLPNHAAASRSVIAEYLDASGDFRVIAPAANGFLYKGTESDIQLPSNVEKGSQVFLAISANADTIAHMVNTDLNGSFIKGGSHDISNATNSEIFNPRLRNDLLSSISAVGISASPTNGEANYSQTDLVTGNGPFPYSLPFTRTYSPSDRLGSSKALPGGWAHNYLLKASTTSDVMAALGGGTDIPAAAMFDMAIGLYVAIDQMAQVDLATSSQGLVRTLLAEATIHYQTGKLYSNSYLAETFEGPKQFWNTKPRVGSADSFAGAGVEGAGLVSELITKEGVRYYYESFKKGYSKNAGTNVVLGANCEALPDGDPPSYGDPLVGQLSYVVWPNGVRIDIEQRLDCYSPISKVTNNLGRVLNISTRSSGGEEIIVDDGTSLPNSALRSVKVKPTRVQYPDGQEINYVFDGPWKPEQGLSGINNLTGSRLMAVKLPAAPSAAFLSLDYDNLGRVKAMTDAVGRVSKYGAGGLNGNFRFGTENSLAERASTYFNDHMQQVRSVDGLGNAARTEYDSTGRVYRQYAPEGNYVQYLYDDRGNIIEERAVAKSGPGTTDLVTLTDYKQDPTQAAGPSNLTTRCAFVHTNWYGGPGGVPDKYAPSCDTPRKITDPRGNVTYLQYDTKGQLVAKRGACPSSGTCAESSSQRIVTGYTYNGVGQPTSVTDPTGVATEYAYAGAPSPHTDAGNLIRTTVDPSGKNLRTVAYYDAVGNVCRAVNARGVAANSLTGTESDACAPSSTVGGAYAVALSYDANRRLLATVDGLGNLATTYYNANGWAEATTRHNAANTLLEKRTTTYYADGQVDETHDPECYNATGASSGSIKCGVIKKTYWTAGRVKDVIARNANDNNGTYTDRVVRSEYDTNGQLLRVVGGYGSALVQYTATYEYSPNGKRTLAMDANGNKTAYAYDGHDRLIKLSYPEARSCTVATPCTTSNPGAISITDYEAYELDPNGNMQWKRTRAGDWVYRDFDALNRETIRYTLIGAKNGGAERVISTGYDAAGRILNVTRTGNGTWFPDQPVVSYQYDTAGRRYKELFAKDDGDTPEEFTLTLDDMGNTTVIGYPGSFNVHYKYDALDRVIKIGSSADGAEYAAYHYDDLSRRDLTTLGNGRTVGYSYWADSTVQDVRQIALIDDDANTSTPNVDALWSFTYTPGNQVKTKQMPSLFRWEPASQQIGPTNYAVNGLNQYTSVRSKAQMYDAKGNLTNDGVKWVYTYDAENRMMTAVNATDDIEASYDYDAIDRRIGKKVDHGAEVTTRYLWLGQNIVAELDDEDTVLRRYVQGAGVDEPVAMIDYTGSSPTMRFYHADHLGSIVALSDASGAISEKYSYSAYGEGGLEGVEGNPFRFTGRQLDPETGLYYYRARYYSPGLGRFMQTDPMGDVDSLNLYQYAMWDPITNKDPMGLYTCDGSDAQCDTFAKGLGLVGQASTSDALSKGQQDTLSEVVKFYGEAGHDNGVKVAFGSFEDERVAQADVTEDGKVTVTIDFSNPSFKDNGSTLAGTIAHEGVHGIDGRNSGGNPVTDDAARRTETNAYTAEAYVAKGLNAFSHVWNPVQGDAGMKSAIPRAVQGSMDLRAIQCQRTGGCK